MIIGGIAAVILLIGIGVVLSGVLGGDDDEAQGEVFLSPAASVGPDPFSADPLAMPPDPNLAQAVSGGPVDVSGSSSVTGQDGAKPGLYGGTMNMAACDPQQIKDFLAANPDKAQAWVDALNADPEVALPDGRPLTVALIPEYLDSLTTMVLTQDTRVTNHGFKNGKATSLQSTLQKGTAVLVDGKGVPRVKCYCGNPLLPPVASKGSFRYTGEKWADFSVTNVTVVQQSTTIINVFVLTDIVNGGLFNRPLGSTGAFDTPIDGATTTTSAPGTTAPGTTAAPTTTQAPTTEAPTTEAPTTTETPSDPSCSARDAPNPATLTFTNTGTDPASVVWIDPDCNQVPQGTVEPGGTLSINTYIGHKFVAQTANGPVAVDVTSSSEDITL